MAEVTFDSDYLRRVVGEALAEGMTDMLVAMPQDPIEYLGYWLLAHAETLEGREKQFLEKENLEKERRDAAHELEQKKLMRQEEERVMLQQALERAKRLEAERVATHRQRLDEYEEHKAALEKDLDERRVRVAAAEADTTADDDDASSCYGSDVGASEDGRGDGEGGAGGGGGGRAAKDADRELTGLEKCAARMEFVAARLRTIDPALFAAMLEWDVESNPPLVQLVRALMVTLGYSRSSVVSPTKWTEVLQLTAPSMLERLLRVSFDGGLKAAKIQRIANATRQLNVRALVSTRPSGNFAAYLLYEWLRVGLELRNEHNAVRLETGDELSDGEDVPYLVGEDVALAEEEDSVDSDWHLLLRENEGAAAAGEADESYGGNDEGYSYD